MIDFQTQAQKFLSITNSVKISSNAQCLYFQLLNIFSHHFWPNELEIDNMTLHNISGLSRQQLTNARSELKKLCLIDYQNGSGSRSGTYTMIDISSAKLNSIVEIANIDEPKIDNLTGLIEAVDSLSGDSQIWGQKILQVLSNAVSKNKAGVYANYYVTAQLFLKAEQTLQTSVIYRLIAVMQHKPDIQDRESYILATIANAVKQKVRMAIK